MYNVREKYPPREVENQIEFEKIMTELGDEQTKLNHPLINKEIELDKKTANLEMQMNAIKIQLQAVRIEKKDLLMERKEINREFHEVKHEFILLNPRDKFVKQEIQ